MEKKELAILINGLRALSTDAAKIADELENMEPAKKKETKPEAPAAETKTYTFEEVRGILAGKSRSGHREAVKALITKYGGTQLSDYKDDPEKLAALVAEAEVIGNG